MSNNAVRSEFGIFPLAVYGLKSSLSFWTHLVNLDQSIYVDQSYSDSLSYSKCFASKFKLFMSIIEFERVWINRSTFSKNKLKYAVCNKLKELYIHYWKMYFYDSGSINGNKLSTLELLKLSMIKKCICKLIVCRGIANFRVSAYSLQIEKGRHKNKLRLLSNDYVLCVKLI